MDANKDMCVNCTKRNDCKIREEIHSDNFYVSDCDNIVLITKEEYVNMQTVEDLKAENKRLKEEIIRLKYKDDYTQYCSLDTKCYAKGENDTCRTFENCAHQISAVEKFLK